MPPSKAIYFFCTDLDRDPVGPHIWDACRAMFDLQDAGVTFEGRQVLEHRDQNGNIFWFVPTSDTLSHAYPLYLDELRTNFADGSFSGIVNSHQGANAPERIFMAHTTGDVPSGTFGSAAPRPMRNLLLSMERRRRGAGLSGWRVTTEATHWSGILYGASPELLLEYPCPLVDIELGSSPPSWSDPVAAKVLAGALVDVFDPDPVPLQNILCAGGVHFESSFAEAALSSNDPAYAVSHILANQWIVFGNYENETSLDRLQRCADSIQGGVHAIVLHENLKSCYKQQLRIFAERLQIPLLKHKALAVKAPGALMREQREPGVTAL